MAYLLVDKKIRHSKAYRVCFTIHIRKSVSSSVLEFQATKLMSANGTHIQIFKAGIY